MNLEKIFDCPKPGSIRKIEMPSVLNVTVMAPHPDDFDIVAVTLRWLEAGGAELFLEVLTGGASGVEDVFAATWDEKTDAREAEQLAACRLFGLEEGRIRFHRLAEDNEGHIVDQPL